MLPISFLFPCFLGLALRNFRALNELTSSKASGRQACPPEMAKGNASYDSASTGKEILDSFGEALSETLSEQLQHTQHFLTIDSSKMDNNQELLSLFVKYARVLLHRRYLRRCCVNALKCSCLTTDLRFHFIYISLYSLGSWTSTQRRR